MKLFTPKYLPGAIVGVKMAEITFKITQVKFAVFVDTEDRRTWDYEVVDGGRRYSQDELFDIPTGMPYLKFEV